MNEGRPHFEMPTTPDNVYAERSEAEIKESQIVRSEFHQALDKTLVHNLDVDQPRIPKEQRRLIEVKDEAGKVLAFRDKFRADVPIDKRYDYCNTWLVVDFDDVINRTTTFNSYLRDQFGQRFGIPGAEYQQMYNGSRSKGQGGKEIVKFSQIIESIKARLPGREQEVDAFIESIPYGDFIDQAVRRALQAVKQFDINNVRISVLTSGEVGYQKMRVDRSGIDEVVDEVFYTEGSKREVLEALLREYHDEKTPRNDSINEPTVITVDDNPTQVEDFSQAEADHKIWNIRWRDRQAKRYQRPTDAVGAMDAENTAATQAPIKLWRAVRLSQDGDGRYGRKNPDQKNTSMKWIDGYTLGTGSTPIESWANVRYHKNPNGNIVVQGRVFRDPDELHNWRELQGLIEPTEYTRVFEHNNWWDKTQDGHSHVAMDPEERLALQKGRSGVDEEQAFTIGEDGRLAEADGTPLRNANNSRFNYEAYIRTV